MNKYKTLYIWMFIPMLFIQFGIFRDYWGDFSDTPVPEALVKQ